MAEEAAKKSSPMKWILIGIGGCLVGLFCCCASCTVISFLNPESQDEFKKEYCQGLEDGGVKPSEDPLGICD